MARTLAGCVGCYLREPDIKKWNDLTPDIIESGSHAFEFLGILYEVLVAHD